MSKRFVCMFLTLILLLSLCACGSAETPASAAPAEEKLPVAETPVPVHETPEATEAPAAFESELRYADAYALFAEVAEALAAEVNSRLDANNAALQAESPESYYMNSNYLMLAYAPFQTAYSELAAALTGADSTETEKTLTALFPDAVLTRTGEGSFEAVYTYPDKSASEVREEDGTVTINEKITERAGKCVWDCDDASGAIRVRAYLDGELCEFTEFVPQGEDSYLLYSLTDLALVKYADGHILSLTHAHRISEAPLGAFPGDMRLYSPDTQDFFPNGTASSSVIKEDADAQYVFTLENDTMTYFGKVPQDLLSAEGERIGVSWQSIDPIILQK